MLWPSPRVPSVRGRWLETRRSAGRFHSRRLFIVDTERRVLTARLRIFVPSLSVGFGCRFEKSAPPGSRRSRECERAARHRGCASRSRCASQAKSLVISPARAPAPKPLPPPEADRRGGGLPRPGWAKLRRLEAEAAGQDRPEGLPRSGTVAWTHRAAAPHPAASLQCSCSDSERGTAPLRRPTMPA